MSRTNSAHEYFSLRIQRQSVCQVPKISTSGALLRIIDLVYVEAAILSSNNIGNGTRETFVDEDKDVEYVESIKLAPF